MHTLDYLKTGAQLAKAKGHDTIGLSLTQIDLFSPSRVRRGNINRSSQTFITGRMPEEVDKAHSILTETLCALHDSLKYEVEHGS